jgi:hypothetical protein
MKRFAGWCALIAVVGFTARAGAQAPEEAPGDPPAGVPPVGGPQVVQPQNEPTLGDPGHWAISLERVFGFDYARETLSIGGVDMQTNSGTSFSLFSSPLSAMFSAFSFPRAGFDVFVAPGLSLGTSVGVFYAKETVAPTGVTATDESVKGILLTPRIGYVLHLAPWVSFWPRGGISIIYASTDVSNGGGASQTNTAHLIAGTIEAPFVFTIAPRVAFTFGPTFDMTFSGGTTTSGYGASATVDERVLEIGAQAGLVVTL